METTRTQRRSDGTATVEGVRFEVPSAYRTLIHLRLRLARWDLSSVALVDPRSGDHLATLFPLDKARNAERIRRVVDPIVTGTFDDNAPSGIAPHLRALMADYAATGLPPAFIPHNANNDDHLDNHHDNDNANADVDNTVGDDDDAEDE